MATDRQEKAVQIYVENGGKSASAAMRQAGYSEATARNPQKLTDSKAWKDLLDKALPDKKLLTIHKKLLNAQKVEHMVFPLGMDHGDIKKLLNSVGCTPKEIQSRQTAIHVWFWSPDFKARAAAVELAYKIKGKITNKIEVDPDAASVFHPEAELTIKVVDGRDNSQPEAADSV